MNFSLQTLILLFLVTVIHIAVIVAIAPLDESAMNLLSNIDAEVETEGGEPISSDSVPEMVSGIDLRTDHTEAIPGFPGQEMDRLRAQPVSTTGAPPSGATGETQSTAAEALPRDAMTQSQAYSGRIEKPKLDEAESAGSDQQISADATVPVQSPAETSRGVREIRPMGR